MDVVRDVQDSGLPKVEYVEFFAEDAASGKPLYEEDAPAK